MPVAQACPDRREFPQTIDTVTKNLSPGGFTTRNQISYATFSGKSCGQVRDERFGDLMNLLAARKTVRIDEPDPFGEVTLAPAAMTGRSETQLARAMAQALLDTHPATASQALKHLRNLFPDSPLTVRVAALNALMRR